MIHQLEEYKRAVYDFYKLLVGENGSVEVVSQIVQTEVELVSGRKQKVTNETGKIIIKIKLQRDYDPEDVRVCPGKIRVYVNEVGWRDLIASVDGEKPKCIFCSGTDCTWWQCKERCNIYQRKRTDEHDREGCVNYATLPEVSKTGSVAKEAERIEILNTQEAFEADDGKDQIIKKWEEIQKKKRGKS